MKKQFPISSTFQTLRNLPLELSFEQVEQWLQQQDFNNIPKKKPGPSWLNRLLSIVSNN